MVILLLYWSPKEKDGERKCITYVCIYIKKEELKYLTEQEQEQRNEYQKKREEGEEKVAQTTTTTEQQQPGHACQ